MENNKSNKKKNQGAKNNQSQNKDYKENENNQQTANQKEKTKDLKPVIEKIKEKKSKEDKQNQTIKDKINGDNEISKLIKIVLIITAIMLVFYGVTIIATKKADEVNNQTTETEEAVATEIQYENIMIGTMLNHQGTYYVLIKAEDDNRVTEYESLVSTIKSSDGGPTIYSANLTDAFNKGYLAKEENYYPEKISEFAVAGTTLVKIKNGKIDSVYDNYDAIKNKLNELL